ARNGQEQNLPRARHAEEGAAVNAAACARVKSLLPFYLEHETGPVDALETAMHLVSCDECAAEADRSRSLTAALRDLAPAAPPRDFAPGIMSRLRRLKSAASTPRAAKWSAIALILGLVLLKGLVPTPAWKTGLRTLARLGELLDLDFLLDRVTDAF